MDPASIIALISLILKLAPEVIAIIEAAIAAGKTKELPTEAHDVLAKIVEMHKSAQP